MNPFYGGWVVWLSILLAMLLSIVHLPQDWPGWLGWLRPSWLLLVLFFWAIEHPQRIGLISAWILGLLTDALLAEPLGLNALLFALFTFVTWRFSERLRMYSMAQQCVVLFALVVGAELVRSAVLEAAGIQGWSWGVLGIGAMSMLCWPFIYELLLRVRTAVRVE